jgi:hypothetical protein
MQRLIVLVAAVATACGARDELEVSRAVVSCPPPGSAPGCASVPPTGNLCAAGLYVVECGGFLEGAPPPSLVCTESNPPLVNVSAYCCVCPP